MKIINSKYVDIKQLKSKIKKMGEKKKNRSIRQLKTELALANQQIELFREMLQNRPQLPPQQPHIVNCIDGPYNEPFRWGGEGHVIDLKIKKCTIYLVIIIL